ncbi:MAG: transporter substrate-binding domain-containing protein [Mesorhizobium sp.]|uniref:transporter substrate-binding domain-containing protein n=1 Tax=Mesorhizobium sp. TaxID=1871066 RepID=UPI001AC0E122|nr:transporter substrate-binding domain-containing protein [Mesorhizobium sp.]MBN9221482.1 transporter substrate-binding domain-containing protein [Mesorhizobium sp.]
MSRKSILLYVLLAAVPAAATPALAEGPGFISGGKLEACVDPTFPPMEFVKTPGQPPVGIDIDVVKALAAHWKVEANITSMDFNGLLPGLESKRCDIVISGALLKPERLEKFSGVPYLKTGVVMIGKAGDTTEYKSYEDFSGKVVAVQTGTSYIELLNKVNDDLAKAGRDKITLQTYPKQTDAIQQVMIGRATGTISQDTEFAYRDLQQPGELKILYAAGAADQYAAYFRKDDADQAAVASAVKALLADGTMKTIAEQWKLPMSTITGVGE